jgi:ABC-type glutathione transport system ATPase component
MTTPTAPPAPLLSVEDLVVTFRSRGLLTRRPPVHALTGVSLTVARGQTVGVVGQSGSGKSTLARTVVGLQEATSGTVSVDGEPVTRSKESLAAMRRHVQMVFQDSLNSLNPRRSILATLAEPLIVHRTVPREGIRDRVGELLRAVGLPPEHMTRRPAQLSGGQRQRVNIARALASEPELIIADEPTSSLDVSVRAQILELLQQLQADRGLSYLFISHDLHVVRHMSDVVVVMKNGAVVEVADKAALYAAPQHEYTKELLAASPTTRLALARSAARGRSMFATTERPS